MTGDDRRADASLGIPRYWGARGSPAPARPSPIWVTGRTVIRLGAGRAPTVAPWRSLDAGCSASARPSAVSARPRPVAARDRTAPRPPRRHPVQPSSSTPVPDAGRSPGRPAPGTIYYGASVPHDRSAARLGGRARLLPGAAPVVLHARRQRDRPAGRSRCRDDLEHGRLPHVSIKPSWTWQDIAVGRARRLAGRACSARSGELVGPGDLHPPPRAGERRRRRRDAAVGLRGDAAPADRAWLPTSRPQVIVAPVLQHWTFDPLRTDVDPAAWMVPEAPVMGLDVYNPWSPTNGKEWRSFGSKMDEVLGWFGDTPLVIGEYGCREDPDNPGLAAEWLRDAADYAPEPQHRLDVVLQLGRGLARTARGRSAARPSRPSPSCSPPTGWPGPPEAQRLGGGSISRNTSSIRPWNWSSSSPTPGAPTRIGALAGHRAGHAVLRGRPRRRPRC